MTHNGPPGSAHTVAWSQLQHEPSPLWSAASELPAHGLSAHLKRTQLVAYRKEAVHEYVCLDRLSAALGKGMAISDASGHLQQMELLVK